MQDFTKEPNAKIQTPINQKATTQAGWLTKNRFWNLVFLFLVPAQIYLAALMWNGWMLLLPLATTIAIFKYVPADLGTLTSEQARLDSFAKIACGIFFANLVAFFFAGNKILSLFGLELGQFGFGEVVFFIFLIPISILCYANIPLAACFETKNSKELYNSGSRFCVSDSRVPYSIRSQNWNR